MLCILRKDGETVCLFHQGVEIRVKINGRNGSRTSLAIDAPPEVKILREEVVNKQPRSCGERVEV